MNQELSERIRTKFAETGDDERLRELLKARLHASGWKDSLVDEARKYIKDKGVQHVSVEALEEHLIPKARSTIPDSVKRELLCEIRGFLIQHGGIV